MKIQMFVKIPGLSKSKTNVCPVKIGDITIGEVSKVIRDEGNSVYFVDVFVYKQHEGLVLQSMAKEKEKLTNGNKQTGK
jgi:hypothetical protein